MTKFVKFLSASHLNGMNVALYQTKAGAKAVVEDLSSSKTLGSRKFDSVEAATEWFDAIQGNDAGKLANAISELTNGKYFA